ncbi:MAG: ABC transporter permease [Chloroflexi bacterium]|nr:ABC transporter permease [Chloroflexota bacterium]
MMEMLRAIYIIWYRELLRFVRERSRMFSALAMPLLFLVIFGAGFKNLVGNLAGGVDFVTFMYPGIVAMSVLMTAFMSGMSIVWDREFGFLREVLVAPIPRMGVALGKTLGGATVAMLQGCLLLFLAPVVGVALTPIKVALLLPMLLVVALAIASLGVLIASRMRSMQAFQFLMTLVFFPMTFLSGVFFPVTNLPPWLMLVVRVNPVTYGVDAIRQLFLQGMTLPAVNPSLGINPTLGALGASPGKDAPYALAVTLFGHPMTMLQDMGVVALFGAVVLSLAVWSFNRQD